MKTSNNSFKKITKATLVTALALGTCSFIITGLPKITNQTNSIIQQVSKKLNLFNEKYPQEAIYIQTDKTLFEPGDNIWIAGYLKNAQTLTNETKSGIVNLELINPKGGIEKKLSVITKNGKFSADFQLNEDEGGGLYKVKAYTTYMKNFSSDGNDVQFEKEIQVQNVLLPNLKMKLDFDKKSFSANEEVVAKLCLQTNENTPLVNHQLKYVVSINGNKIVEKNDITDEEGIKFIKFNLPKKLKSTDGLLNIMIQFNGTTESVSRSIPISLNNIKLDFFAEGGELLSQFNNNLAFRATNEFGKPADVTGTIYSASGDSITSFSSFHNGMGSFTFIPKNNTNYYAKITSPLIEDVKYNLPSALNRGYNLLVSSTENNLKVKINTTEEENLSVITQIRGAIVNTATLSTKNGINELTIPTTTMPIGVAQITVFDAKGIARAERLSFVNKHKQLQISIETDKEKYLPREKVKLNIQVKDDKGLPIPGNISLAVVNDQLLSMADDKQANIVSQLLLQQEIKDKIIEPNFYFDNKEAKANKALDYLLLTSGWRKFSWEKIIAAERIQMNYLAEQTIFAGKVLDAYTAKPITSAKITISNTEQLTSDINGSFYMNNLDLTDAKNIQVKADGYYAYNTPIYNYNQEYIVYMYPTTYKQYNNSSMNATSKSVPMSAGGFAENKRAEIANEDLEAIADKDFAVVDLVKADARAKMPSPKKEMAKPGASEKIVAVNDKKKIDKNDKEGNVFKAANLEEVEIQHVGAKSKFVANNRSKNSQTYYRAKTFAAPVYKENETPEYRSDFRNTVYWNPSIDLGYNGKASVEFYLSDDITSFRAIAEGGNNFGDIGRGEKLFYTQLPFNMFVKVPTTIVGEDEISIPVTLKNNTTKPLGGALLISGGNQLFATSITQSIQTIMPGVAKTILLNYKAKNCVTKDTLSISFKCCGLSDGIVQPITINSKGYPQNLSFASQEKEMNYTFDVNHIVNGSLKIQFTAHPNVVSDLMTGVEGILREPSGCFEQTSMTAYPNAMVLDYLKATESKDDKALAYAGQLLDRGYKRLTTFEANTKGYEWFGASPAHQGLTALGIMEFTDMKKAGGKVDTKMIERTADWLIAQKDGNGGFLRNTRAYHDFGSISNEILNSYIVYALAEAGFKDIDKEYKTSLKTALEKNDAYQLAMMASAATNLNDTKNYTDLINKLKKLQKQDGSFTGSSHSITYSQGNSLTIETTALSILAMLKGSNDNLMQISNAVNYLVKSRSGYGVFSSTQGTILALKALTEFAKASKKTSEDGTIEVYLDNKKIAEKNYKAGDKGAIALSGLEKNLIGEGKHNIKVKFVDVKTPLPYSIAIDWNTTLPNSQKECEVDLKTNIQQTQLKVGETARMKCTVTNKTNKEIPSTMVLIGIPAGLSAQPWQLKELQDKKVFDYYEIKDNKLALYYRGMDVSDIKEINLDLKAEIVGTYEAPASVAYLYYTNEYKTWSPSQKVTIK